MSGFINYLEDNCNYDPNPFLITAREGNLNKNAGRSARNESEFTRLLPKNNTHQEENYNFDHISAPFEKYELAEVTRSLKPLLNTDKNDFRKDLFREFSRHTELFLTNNTELFGQKSNKTLCSKRRDVFERLTDHRFFTGIHRERFDENGRGRGLAGRENLFLFDGNTESFSRAHEVYSSVLPTAKRVPFKSRPVKKFGLQIATPKLMWLYRNGDKHHDGIPFYLRPFIRSMETLHIEIGKELTLIAGPVRKIYDQNLRRVTNLDDIVDGAKYLCTSADKLEKFMSEWVIQKMF